MGEETKMNFIVMPRLEHMAIIKTAIAIWNHDDIMSLMIKSYFRKSISTEWEKWEQLEKKVKEKTENLLLPESLKQEILNVIKPIGIEILKWKNYHENFLSDRKFVRMSLNRLCWTPNGIVDKKKTAEILIEDEKLDITRRYKLACLYCLKDAVPILWSKIPGNRKKYFYNDANPNDIRQHRLIVLWTYDIRGILTNLESMIENRWRPLCSPYRFGFEYAALTANVSATEYFLNKLTPVERDVSLIDIAEDVAERHINSDYEIPRDYPEILRFLLSQMNEEQEKEVFKLCPYDVLKCFLNWPWQCFYMNIAERMCYLLSEFNYNRLIERIIDKMKFGHKDYNYRKLFREFWQEGSTAQKRYVLNEIVSWSWVLRNLLEMDDEINVKLILRDATPVQKHNIIFCWGGKCTCQKLIDSDKWHMLEILVKECISTKEEMKQLRDDFKERRGTRRFYQKETKERRIQWNKFLQLMDRCIREYSKRKNSEESDNNSTIKKIRKASQKNLTNRRRKRRTNLKQ